jgi:hypothetical protein
MWKDGRKSRVEIWACPYEAAPPCFPLAPHLNFEGFQEHLAVQRRAGL